MRKVICERCDRPFIDTSRRQQLRYCCDNCRKRANEERRMHVPCINNCGNLTWIKNGRSGVCVHCIREQEHDLVMARGSVIAEWWREGKSLGYIGEQLGWTVIHVSVEMNRLRKAGLDLPLRKQGSRGKIDKAKWA